MQISPSNDLWKRIYPNLRNEYFTNVTSSGTLEQFEHWLRLQGIIIHRDNNRIDGCLWQTIELPDNEELTELLLKWG